MGKKLQFVHRATRYEMTREDFIRAVKGVSAGPRGEIHRHHWKA